MTLSPVFTLAVLLYETSDIQRASPVHIIVTVGMDGPVLAISATVGPYESIALRNHRVGP